MVEGTDSRDEPLYPDSPESAYTCMVGLMDAALSDGRSAILITMEHLSDSMIDVNLGIMNLNQHEKGLMMVAFAVVHMSRKSKSDIREDMVTLERFVERMSK